MFRAGRIHLIPYLILGFDTIEVSYPACTKPSTQRLRVALEAASCRFPWSRCFCFPPGASWPCGVLKQQACTKFKVFEKKCEISVFTWCSDHNLMISIGLSRLREKALGKPFISSLRCEEPEMLLPAPVFEENPGQCSFWYAKVFLFGASARNAATTWISPFICQ